MNTNYTKGMIKALRIYDGIGTLSVINLLITVCLNLAWILVCMRECYRNANRYLTCKRTPDLL